MEDAVFEAELIVEGAAVVAGAEVVCLDARFADLAGRVAIATEAMARAAGRLAEAFKPWIALAEQVERETAEDIALWDDELPF